jgi:DNA-binding transcriptional LysR family regulator
MSTDQIDLKLLRVFDAIFEDRNLGLAGKRLHLSQSAISHALARLREVLVDDLFVRTGRGMVRIMFEAADRSCAK